mgnify:CR=1 FL=1
MVFAAVLFVLLPACLSAAPPGQGGFYGSLRSRIELWDWYQGAADNFYVFNGNLIRAGWKQSRGGWDWNLELAGPLLLGLPSGAIAPAPQGQFGMGAAYYSDSGRKRNAGMVFPKQASITLHREARGRHRLELGRFEFADGAELTPKNAALAALKNTRIRERLVGTFGFTHVGRSFDGFHYGYEARGGRLTVVGAAPTRGVFQTDGWGWTGTGLGYLAWTQPVAWGEAGEWRLFGIYYQDWRKVLKTDNRPPAARAADGGNIRIGTFGGHWVQIFPSGGGSFDGLLWGVVQAGRWGRLDHAGWALAVEGGWQPKRPVRLRPWLRGGVFLSSGDADPADGKHQTFFQILPTPRLYARYPYYNLMNLEDFFGTLILRPYARLSLRSDVHGLRLRQGTDLWYVGGGAYNPWTFGYAGRPSRGARSLATLFDLSADWSLTPTLALTFYFARSQGKSVIRAIYPEGPNARMAFLELHWRF